MLSMFERPPFPPLNGELAIDIPPPAAPPAPPNKEIEDAEVGTPPLAVAVADAEPPPFDWITPIPGDPAVAVPPPPPVPPSALNELKIVVPP
jgi:hypothetical protein